MFLADLPDDLTRLRGRSVGSSLVHVDGRGMEIGERKRERKVDGKE